MPKIYPQATVSLLSHSGSLAAGASISGSAPATGYARLVGGVTTNASTVSACGIFVEQSFNEGLSWDLISASNTIAACTTAACDTAIIGNYVRVRIHNGATAASLYRANFYLRPI